MDYNNHDPRGAVYHTRDGFYQPYVEPAWIKEKKSIRKAGNGLGFTSLGYVVFLLCLAPLFATASLLLGEYATATGSLELKESIDWILNSLNYILTLTVPFAIYALCIKMPLRVALPFNKTRLDLTFEGVCICLGLTIVASLVTGYIQTGLEFFGIGITMPEYDLPTTLPGYVFYAINLTVMPAFLEEIVFRGIIMQSLRRFGDVFALVASALIFGIFHLNLIQLPYAFVMGLGIGFFAMRTGSLWVGVIIHLINNLIATAIEFLSQYLSEDIIILINAVFNCLFAVLGVICLVILLIKYKHIFSFKKSSLTLSGGKKVFYYLTTPGIILALIAATILTLPYIYLI